MKLDPSSLLFACAAACLSTTGFSQADIPPEDWTKQIGTAAEDHTTGVAHDGAGGAFVSGSINATGNQQCYAARIGAQGQTVWQSILGSNSWLEETYGVLADGEGGCWVISKAHQASDWLAPGLSPGGSSYDGILLRYNSGGTLIVSTRIGDVWDNEPTAICSDGAGGVFVGGLDSGFGDIWLLRVDSQGTQLWFEDIDPPTGRIDELSSLCPDGAGGCYLGGAGGGDVFGPGSGLGSDDSILLRFDSAGNQTGGVQFGTSSRDKLYALALADNGDVFCGGTTLGSFGGPSAGSFDVFVSRMDSSLSTVWVRQFGSSGGEYPTTIGVRDDGSLVLAGLTGGALGGPSFGNVDAWLATMDASGAGLGLLQVGTNVPEFGGYVAVGSGEDVFLAGWSGGLFGAQQYGSTDLFVRKYGLPGQGLAYCSPAIANSSGFPASLQAEGSNLVFVNDLTLMASDLPTNQFGYVLNSRGQDLVMNPTGSQGNLCLGGGQPIGRHNAPGNIRFSGTTGSFQYALNATSLPQPTGPVFAVSGETWNFQVWYRDFVGGQSTSNFSNAVSITFQ